MIEAEYFFPISTNACFEEFSAFCDGNQIKGEIKAKKEAQ